MSQATIAPPEPPPPRIRDRLIPRSTLGLSALVLFAALGAAFSGAVLYSYYEYKLDQNEQKVTEVVTNATKSLDGAKQIIDAEKESAKEEVRAELEPLRRLAASEETIERLIEKVAPAVWFVHTVDEAGQPSVGSAFVVAADADSSLLVTSFAVVRAATRQPGPEVKVRKGGDDLAATLWTWQEERDLALLVVRRPNLAKLTWATGDSAVRLGERVFAVSGLGGAGAAVTQGFVADVYAEGIQHTALVGAAFRGGPLVNSSGEVVGVSSRDYAPLGFAPGDVTFAVPVRKACDRVLRCPGGSVGAGEQGG